MPKVLLTITGVQNGTENVELITEGFLRENNKTLTLEYSETEISGMEGTKNIITIHDSMITLAREGEVRTSLYFEQGKRFIGNYETDLGTLNMSVFPTLVSSHHDATSGTVDLEYELDLEGEQSVNRLSLSYKTLGSTLN
ncbi:MAG: DUF1934 domain-containing protein [Eubacteriales bacterium]